MPSISIPIYELKGRSVSVGLSLNYHASGIKVGEYASSVGLGWSLQAGGCITRSVRGLPDEESGAGYLSIRAGYHNAGDLSSGTTPVTTDSIDQLDIAKGLADAEPDLFMINAMGKSYKFMFSGDGTIVTQPYSNLKITASFSDSSWTVITEDGTKLRFGGGNKFVETSSSPNFDNGSAVTSWYLKSITSFAGEVINFTYTVSNINHESYYYQSDYLFDHIAINNLLVGNPLHNKLPLTKSQNQQTFILNLATIESDLCRVIIDTLSRIDLPGAAAITGVRVYSKLTNTFLKSYKLYYTYSTAIAGNTYGTDPGKRLKLDTLEEIPTDNTPHKYWQFAYNPKTLPSRKSYAQDYWGYFNGATSNSTMLPFCVAFNPDQYPYGQRYPDSASMMAEMLTKVTYPTGGYSLFLYEPNSYPANEEQFTPHSDFLHLYLTFNQTGFTNTQTTSFTITRQQYFKFQFTGVFSPSYQSNFGPSTLLASATLSKTDGTPLTTISLVKGNSGVAQNSTSILIQPGSYNFTMSSISPQSDFHTSADNVDLSSNYTIKNSTGFKNVNHPVGGVRVQGIIYYDNIDTTKSIKKFYQYENPNIVWPVDSTVDFLSPTADNVYDCDQTLTDCGLPGCIASSVVYQARNASTKYSLGSIQGGTVGYGKVTESFGLNAENGRNIYYYSYTPDINVTQSQLYPYPSRVSMDYERGLLLEEDNFTASGQLVRKSRNTYQYIRRRSINTYKAAYQFNILTSCFSFTVLSGLIARIFYPDYADEVQHSTATQATFNTATGDSLVNKVSYYYDDTLNMQPIRTVSFNSKGDSVLTYSRTVFEKAAINTSIPLSTAASIAIDSMQARNMVVIPIESEKYTKSILTGKALTNYKLQTSGLVLADNVQVQNATNTLETRAYFPRYNIKGNLLEQLKSADEKHDYIWDYQYNYPVAEVVNADSNSIAFTSFEADGTGNWNVSSTARDSVTPAITGYKSYNLSSGSISTTVGLLSTKTYIISYWSKSGSSYTVTSGGTPKQGKTVTVNGTAWTYFEHTITGVTSISITGANNIDELRMYPVGAQMTTFSYLPLIGITSQCDLNNRITYYQYDGFQNLYVILDQDRNAIKKFCYNYNGQAIACSQFYNVAKSGIYTRDNCGAGYTGGSYTYVVAANKYASLVSQAAADALAQSDVNANGQAAADMFGSCTFTGVTITSTNTTGLTGFTATFTNTSTLVQTVLNIPAAGGNIGSLPAATYNITLAKTGNTTVKYVYGVCGTIHGSAVTSTFSNVVVGTSCHSVSVDTVE